MSSEIVTQRSPSIPEKCRALLQGPLIIFFFLLVQATPPPWTARQPSESVRYNTIQAVALWRMESGYFTHVFVLCDFSHKCHHTGDSSH